MLDPTVSTGPLGAAGAEVVTGGAAAVVAGGATVEEVDCEAGGTGFGWCLAWCFGATATLCVVVTVTAGVVVELDDEELPPHALSPNAIAVRNPRGADLQTNSARWNSGLRVSGGSLLTDDGSARTRRNAEMQPYQM